MKRFISIQIFVAMIILVTTGCQKDDFQDNEIKKSDIAVNLTSNIAPAPVSAPKSASGNRAASGEIGLYMIRTGQPLNSANAVYSNVVMNAAASAKHTLLVSDSEIMYPASGNVDFIAYSPYSASVENDCTVDVNIADQALALPAEIMYSSNAVDKAPTEQAVNLDFSYPLAKLQVTLTGAHLLPADYLDMSITIEGMPTQAKLNLENGEIFDRQDVKSIKMHRTNVSYSCASFDAILLPTTVAEALTFVVKAGGKTYEYRQSVNYQANRLYICDMRIGTQVLTLHNIETLLRNSKAAQDNTVTAGADDSSLSYMTMKTAKQGKVMFGIGGSGQMLINWGDGTVEKYDISGKALYTHIYNDAAPRSINIYGEDIHFFDCGKIIDDHTNDLTHVDFSGNKALKYLRVVHNELTSLDLGENTALESLFCENNHLTDIDLSNNTGLIELHISHNRLSYLDISEISGLEIVSCANNRFENLDLSKNTSLLVLDCAGNKLKTLDISNNKALIDLRLNNNLIENLYLGAHKSLVRLFCQNNGFDVAGLNALFGSMHDKELEQQKIVFTKGNPGTDGCDNGIAKNKGWKVDESQ